MNKFVVLNPIHAAIALLTKLDQAIQTKKHIYFGVCGGNSLKDFYKHLAENWTINLKQVSFYLTDERLTLTNSELNITTITTQFFNPLKERAGKDINIYLPKEGAFPYPKSDFLLLSSGEDGHIASLFPNKEELNCNSSNYLKVTNAPKSPPDRLSISPKIIQSAENTFLFFIGKSKKESLDKFLNPNLSLNDCPAKLTLGSSNELILVTNLIS